MEGRKRLRDEGEGVPGGGAAAAGAAAAGGASREDLLALLAARDAQLAAFKAERDAQLATRDAQLAAVKAEHDAQLAAAKAAGDAAKAERDAAVAAAAASEAGRGASAAAAEAERAFANSLLARDATLAAALAERDEGRRLMAQPSVRAALLGERLIDVIGIVAAVGYAAEVSHCLHLCGVTWRKGDKGATNDMIARSLERQSGLSAARAAVREDCVLPDGIMVHGSTQLIRAAVRNDLPRVLQLVQLGASLELVDTHMLRPALHWACWGGHEAIVKALIDGKYERRAAAIDLDCGGHTPLSIASYVGHEGIVSLLLACGAGQELQTSQGTALHSAVSGNEPAIITLLSAAPGFAAALALRDRNGRTPLALAIRRGHAACEAVLRAHGAAA